MRLGAHQCFAPMLVGGRQRRRGNARLAAEASAAALVLSAGLAAQALAQTAPAAAPPAKDLSQPVATASAHGAEHADIIINGVRYRDTVLPTRLSSDSTYGLNLSVMDTPRNTTLLSTTQLETLNIEDPRAFSYLTASSYTDSAFGTPNIPRIRGQYADLFINGMRSSFTDNGYGVPPDFDSIENISITKGPASVIDGPGPGVGGQADLITKRPSLTHFQWGGSASLDSVANRRVNLDAGGPIIEGTLGVRISYSGEQSNSYFYDHYTDKNALYVAVRWRPTDKYQADFNTEVSDSQYTENVGVNRVNQALIDKGEYIQGQPVGEVNSQLYGDFGGPGDPTGNQGFYTVGSPGNPYSPVMPFLTLVNLTNEVPLNTRETIDEAPQTSSRALKYNAQLIQTYDINSNLTVENNTFFDYQDSDNQEQYYYADNSNGSWTFENRTELKGQFEFGLGGLDVTNQWVTGLSYRFAHTSYISNYSAETPGAYDITANPALFVTNAAYQEYYADAFPYTSVFGRTQLGTPGRDSINSGNTGVSDLYDGAVFFQDRMEFDPQWSLMFGGRMDAVQNHTHDPLGGAICGSCLNGSLLQNHSTGVFGLGDANVSLTYRPQPWVTTYLTLDATQSNNPNGGEGGINTYGTVLDLDSTGLPSAACLTKTASCTLYGTPDSKLLRVDSYLYEAGLKLDLLDRKLFVGGAVFDQKREVPTGPGGTATAQANIRGVEVEANYQPNRNVFATASYSYIDTTLNSPAGFYNYPAMPGVQYGANNPTLVAPGVALAGNYIDGAGVLAVFAPGQKFNDPGVPQHIFNFLYNYKFDYGLGFRYGVQVTGPIQTTSSGQLDLSKSLYVPQYVVNDGGYYHSPVIPWQFTMNVALFYTVGKYTTTLSIYNFTNQTNWQSAPTYYGNDFLVRNDPRTFELRFQAKF